MERKRTTKRIMSLVVILAMVISMITVPAGTAQAATVSTIKKLTVTATGTKLYEGQKLTKAMVQKSVKVVATKKNGKKSTIKSAYTCSQIGKTITRNKNGKYTLTIKYGGKTKKAAVKVNAIKQITVSTKIKSLKEGSTFDQTAFKNATTVKALYSNGTSKKVTTYTVTVNNKVVSGTKFPVTIKAGNVSKKLNIPVIADPDVAKYTISVQAENGTVKIDGKVAANKIVKDGTVVSLEAFPNEGYQFKEWKYASGRVIGTLSPISIAVTENVTLIAVFEKIPVDEKCKITVSATNGRVTIDGESVSSKTVSKGTKVLLNAVANSGYQFENWTSGGRIIGTVTPIEIEVTSDMTIAANFKVIEKTKYTVTVSASNGSVTIDGEAINSKTVESGTIVILSAIPASGYEFVSWTAGNQTISSTATTQFVVTSNVSVTANFAKVVPSYTVYASASAGTGTVSIDNAFVNSKTVKAGTGIVLKAIPATGYTFVDWECNGTVLGTSTTLNLTVTSNMAIIALFKKTDSEESSTTQYTVTLTSANHGSVKIDGASVTSKTVTKGTNVSLVATPDANYKFVDWEDNEGNVLGTNKTLNLTVNKPYKITAVFQLITYTLTVNSNYDTVKLDNHSMNFTNGSATKVVAAGTSVTLTASNGSSYEFSRYTNASGTTLSSNKSYTFTVNSDTTVNVAFKELYMLTVQLSGGTGDVSLDGTDLNFSSNVAKKNLKSGTYTLSVDADDSYNYVSMTENNKVLTTSTTCNLGLSGDTTVIVNFAEKNTTVTVTYKNEFGETLTSQAVSKGESLAPSTNVYRDGYTFGGWKIGSKIFYGSVSANDASFVADDSTTLRAAIKALTSAGSDVTVVAYYTANPVVEKYTLSVQGGTVTSPTTIPSGGLEKNTHVYVTANAPASGYVFSHWNNNSEKVSTSTNYDFYITGNTVLEAVFVEETVPVVQEPLVFFTGDKYSINYDDNYVKFTFARDIPDGANVTEWGLLISTKYNKEDVTIANATKIKINSENYDNTNLYWTYTLRDTYLVHEGANKTVSARVYAIIDGEDTIYSSVSNSLQFTIN